MLTTVLDLLGLLCVIGAVLLAAALLGGAWGLVAAMAAVAVSALLGSWLADRLKRP